MNINFCFEMLLFGRAAPPLNINKRRPHADIFPHHYYILGPIILVDGRIPNNMNIQILLYTSYD